MRSGQCDLGTLEERHPEMGIFSIFKDIQTWAYLGIVLTWLEYGSLCYASDSL